MNKSTTTKFHLQVMYFRNDRNMKAFLSKAFLSTAFRRFGDVFRTSADGLKVPHDSRVSDSWSHTNICIENE